MHAGHGGASCMLITKDINVTRSTQSLHEDPVGVCVGEIGKRGQRERGREKACLCVEVSRELISLRVGK